MLGSVAVFVLALSIPTAGVAAPGGGGPPSADDPATSIYVEQVPAAAGSSTARVGTGASSGEDAATSIYTERPPTAGGVADSTQQARAKSLEELLTSPTLGAPERVRPLPGDDIASSGTFSFDTVREVAGVGTARFAALLVVLALITVTLGATALTTFSRR